IQTSAKQERPPLAAGTRTIHTSTNPYSEPNHEAKNMIMKRVILDSYIVPSIQHLFRRLPNRLGCFVIAIRSISFILSSIAPALSPPPDGGYANNNTAEGQDALFSLTSGFGNTALGYEALHALTVGGDNVAVGENAMLSDTSGGGNTAVGTNSLSDNT